MQKQIEILLSYAKRHSLIDELDGIVARNALLALFDFSEPWNAILEEELSDEIDDILAPLLDYAYAQGRFPDNTTLYRDLFEDQIMACLTPRQSQWSQKFYRDLAAKGHVAAAEELFSLSKATNYVKTRRIAQNLYWKTPTIYGDLEITINLSKPEKDPKEIAAALAAPPSSYPACLLCLENIGYAGGLTHPPRRVHRVVPITLAEEAWYLQYSPYQYYEEHCIALSKAHTPIAITRDTFVRLFDFTDILPHYFIGSNADLPIVGGSILSHDHFQGGRHTFPMELAAEERFFAHPKYPGLKLSVLRWPLSTLRLRGVNKAEVIEACDALLKAWQNFSNPELDILSHTNGTPHNTITPVARRESDGTYRMDLILRNNRTSDEHPDGIFHPHKELHHVKKENIGLIEAMGLAVLPGRLAQQVLSSEDQEGKRQEIGDIFAKVLEHSGVFKRDEKGQAAFDAFLLSMGFAALSMGDSHK